MCRNRTLRALTQDSGRNAGGHHPIGQRFSDQRHSSHYRTFTDRNRREESRAAADLRIAFEEDLASRNMGCLFGVDRADQVVASEVVHGTEEGSTGRHPRVVLQLDAHATIEGRIGADVDVRTQGNLPREDAKVVDTHVVSYRDTRGAVE